MLFTQRRRLQEKYRRVRFGNISYLELEKVSKQIILITKISRLNLNDIYYFCVQYMYFINFVYLYWRNGFKSKEKEIGNTVLWLEIISFCFAHIKFQLKSSHLHNFYLEKKYFNCILNSLQKIVSGAGREKYLHNTYWNNKLIQSVFYTIFPSENYSRIRTRKICSQRCW